VGGADLGAWFDKASGALIMDQRTLWVFVLLVLVVRGAGPFSVDRLLKRTVV
jgi:putative oxidoreductase